MRVGDPPRAERNTIACLARDTTAWSAGYRRDVRVIAPCFTHDEPFLYPLMCHPSCTLLLLRIWA